MTRNRKQTTIFLYFFCKTLVFSFVFLFFSSFFSPISAAENFSTNYTVTYKVQENGITHTTMKISLVNKTTQYYAASYKIHVGFEKLSNVKAIDDGGAITPVVTEEDGSTSIALTFNKNIVGLNKSLNFTLSFDSPEIAGHIGNIWEINIPGIGNQEDFSIFNVTIETPSSFGRPTYIKPQQKDNSLTFTKEQLGKSGISLAFGSEQYYSFHLLYHLLNTQIVPVKTEIALPPDTNYQSVFIDSISPKPQNVRIDKDGNYLAEFNLLASEKKDISVNGEAILELRPRETILSRDETAEYTKQKAYWQVGNTEIKKLAHDLKTPEKIYRYVVDTLSYDFERVTMNRPRLGAVGVLKTPSSAVCLEFTDLFITIARAAGIPAREINGFAFTENEKQRPLSLIKDILHAWPEYYDGEKKEWIMVDPTWENTTHGIDYFNTFDFDHLAFAIKGTDSTYPVPAGGYKYQEDEIRRDVFVSFANKKPEVISSFDIKPLFDNVYSSNTPIVGEARITNTGNTIVKNQRLQIISKELLPHEQELVLPGIPPFGSANAKVPFQKTPFLTNKAYTFTIQVQSQQGSAQIFIKPFFLAHLREIGGISLVVLMLGLLTFTIKTWGLPLLRRKP